MAEGKERQRRREERQAAEARAAQEARRKRLVALGTAAVLLAGVLVAVLIVVSQGGDDGGDGGDIGGGAQVERQLEGIPQNGTVLGNPDAEVTVSEFGDLQCPVCAQYSEQVIPQLIDGPVRAGTATLDFRNWVILSPPDGDSGAAARAALAAGNQDRLWQFVELFYRNQGFENSGYVDDEFLRGVAEAARVPDLERWEEDRDDPRWDAVLSDVDREARELGFSGTPSFAVSGPGGSTPLGTPGSAGPILGAIRQAG
jgi:protein-disulfide isomerase